MIKKEVALLEANKYARKLKIAENSKSGNKEG
jgi:hypothetical protein